jgi:hypothetical protein
MMAHEDLAHISPWAKASSEQSQYQINKIVFKDTALHLNSVQLPLLDSEALLGTTGLLTQASLQFAKKRLSPKCSTFKRQLFNWYKC